MRYLAQFAVLVLACSGLVAQASPELAQQSARVSAAISSVSQYCQGVETFQATQQPLLFASVAYDGRNATHWRRFDTRADWEKEGDTVPAALAWMRNGEVIAVRLAFHSDTEGINMADYCFREDGTLAKLSVSVKRRQEWKQGGLYAKIKVALTWYFGADGQRIAEVGPPIEPSPLKAEKTEFVYIQPPLFLSVWELPFISLLYGET